MADRDDPDVSTDALARAAWTTMAHLFMTSTGRFEGIAESMGIPMQDLGALMHLGGDSAPSQRELADDWRCDASWVTAKVDRLEQLGLAERRPHPSDRRQKTINLTDAGRRTREAALQKLYEPPAPLRALSATDVRTLARILGKLDVPDPQDVRPRAMPRPFAGGPASTFRGGPPGIRTQKVLKSEVTALSTEIKAEAKAYRDEAKAAAKAKIRPKKRTT